MTCQPLKDHKMYKMCKLLCLMIYSITCHTPHQRKSNSLIPGGDQCSPLLCTSSRISQVSSLLLHTLTYVHGRHLSVRKPNPVLSRHLSLCLCSVMKRFDLTGNYRGLAGLTAVPWLDSVFERSWAEPTALWTQRWPLPAVCGQRRAAGPGLRRLSLRFLTSACGGQGFDVWPLNIWAVSPSWWLRFGDILSGC